MLIGAGDLPDPEGGVDTYLKLAEILGEEYMFRLLRIVRDNINPNGAVAASEASQILANRMLAVIIAENPELEPLGASRVRGPAGDSASRRLADRLGYTLHTRGNFYRLLAGEFRGRYQRKDRRK